jgi:hypothetical protein
VRPLVLGDFLAGMAAERMHVGRALHDIRDRFDIRSRREGTRLIAPRPRSIT